MLKIGILSSATLAMFVTATGTSPASAEMLDRTGIMCGQAIVTSKFQQEGAKREVDVEVYASSRGEKWRLEIRTANGTVLHRINRTTGSDAAFDVWRYVPPTTKKINVNLSGPSDQSCSINLVAK
jgi:hypothetical protein